MSGREPARRMVERAEIRTAIAKAAVGATVSLELGNELIAASREVVAAYYERENTYRRFTLAIARLEELVGRGP